MVFGLGAWLMFMDFFLPGFFCRLASKGRSDNPCSLQDPGWETMTDPLKQSNTLASRFAAEPSINLELRKEFLGRHFACEKEEAVQPPITRPPRPPPPLRDRIHTSPTMSLSCRYAAQCCARQIRSTPSVRTNRAVAVAQERITRRYQSTEAASAPSNPKIGAIVDQISQLTLLETADLVTSLKVGQNHPP